MAVEGGSRRLVVEVCNAKNLMPKDGQGTASAYAIVDFDGQRRRTKTKIRDLNPQWDERLEFLVHDPEAMASETLEINVYNDKKAGRRSTFLGKVKISGATFVAGGGESLVYFPLEKRSVFSQIKGEIGLKISYIDDPPPPPPPAAATPAADEKKAEAGDDKAAAPAAVEAPVVEDKKPEEAKAEPKEEEKKENPPATPTKDGEKKPEDSTAAPATPGDAAKPKGEKPKTPPPTPEPASQAAKETPQRPGDLEIRAYKGSERTTSSSSSYDLVDRVPYLFVRVLKAKQHDATDGERPMHAKVVIGSHSVKTRSVKPANHWDQVFAFHKDSLNSTALEVSVWVEEEKKDGDAVVATEATLGAVSFELQEIPKRSPPADSPLAPQWYTLEGSPAGGDVMLAVWVGTQADEAFQEAWQSDSGGLVAHTRSKAYLSPKLWYLRLTVIQTQDLRLPPLPEAKARVRAEMTAGPELYVKAQLGGQLFKTGRVALCSSSSSANPSWNEDLVFVAAEPFDPFLTVVVEDATAGVAVGQAKVALSSVHRRTDDRAEPPPRWLNLAGDEARPYAGRVHVRVCLEGGYHVLDEAAHAASDVRAASKHLSKPPVGLLEVGVRGAANLVPMKAPAADGAGGMTDAYVVLKYGPKWARTRTIVDQFNPRWNEQYAWDVFDPCTVLTVAVFDNARYKTATARDARIGKLRIRVSTLDSNRVHAATYPLTAVYPSGAKKMGEIELAVRFTSASWLSLVTAYTTPVLPRMHYIRPLGPAQQDLLRQTAIRAVSARLARSEPPLGPEVVNHMLDTDTHVWSMRRSKTNWLRVVSCLSGLAAAARWAHGVRMWAHPPTTVLVHALLAAVVLCPHMVVSTAFMYMFLTVAWRYRGRPRGPAGMDPRLSQVDGVGADEFDEEFDGFPSSRPADVVKVRYDRLRALAGRVQALLGDVASQGERVEALLNWRDRRATGIFVAFCLVASLVFYVVPIRVLVLLFGVYHLRHPRFRDDMPSVPVNFFRRLPSLANRIL